MTTSDINTVIDCLVSDDDLRARVLMHGADSLGVFSLEPQEATALAEAVKADGGAEPFTHLRQQARFEPLFAAASASATKIG